MSRRRLGIGARRAETLVGFFIFGAEVGAADVKAGALGAPGGRSHPETAREVRLGLLLRRFETTRREILAEASDDFSAWQRLSTCASRLHLALPN